MIDALNAEADDDDDDDDEYVLDEPIDLRAVRDG